MGSRRGAPGGPDGGAGEAAATWAGRMWTHLVPCQVHFVDLWKELEGGPGQAGEQVVWKQQDLQHRRPVVLDQNQDRLSLETGQRSAYLARRFQFRGDATEPGRRAVLPGPVVFVSVAMATSQGRSHGDMREEDHDEELHSAPRSVSDRPGRRRKPSGQRAGGGAI